MRGTKKNITLRVVRNRLEDFLRAVAGHWPARRKDVHCGLELGTRNPWLVDGWLYSKSFGTVHCALNAAFGFGCLRGYMYIAGKRHKDIDRFAIVHHGKHVHLLAERKFAKTCFFRVVGTHFSINNLNRNCRVVSVS